MYNDFDKVLDYKCKEVVGNKYSKMCVQLCKQKLCCEVGVGAPPVVGTQTQTCSLSSDIHHFNFRAQLEKSGQQLVGPAVDACVQPLWRH